MTNHAFGFYWLIFFGVILVRYFLVAGGAYLLFYGKPHQPFAKRRLRRKPPAWNLIRKEIELSILSTVIFALGAAVILSAFDRGSTLLYTNLDRYGLEYLGISFITVLVLQDAYFYGIHRLFHHPLLFKWLHQGHHYSGDPTPWTSFAFDPLEALVQALFLVGIVFVIPLHFLTIVAVLMTMTLWTVWNHLGFELFPPSFPRHWFSKWFIGPTHHSIHHRKYTVHYGLYFTVWDKLLGTHDPVYENEFDSALRTRLKPPTTPI